MGRRIITKVVETETPVMRSAVTGAPPADAAVAAGAPQLDSYFDKVAKYIPADAVALWVAASGLIEAGRSSLEQTQIYGGVLWGVLVFGTAFSFIWTLRQTEQPGKRPAMTQAIISAVSFVVWVFALGGPFNTISTSFTSVRPAISGLILIGYTLVVALINPPEG